MFRVSYQNANRFRRATISIIMANMLPDIPWTTIIWKPRSLTHIVNPLSSNTLNLPFATIFLLFCKTGSITCSNWIVVLQASILLYVKVRIFGTYFLAPSLRNYLMAPESAGRSPHPKLQWKVSLQKGVWVL